MTSKNLRIRHDTQDAVAGLATGDTRQDTGVQDRVPPESRSRDARKRDPEIQMQANPNSKSRIRGKEKMEDQLLA